jgi:hypothetical protein
MVKPSRGDGVKSIDELTAEASLLVAKLRLTVTEMGDVLRSMTAVDENTERSQNTP